MIEPQNLIEIIHNGLDNLADSDKMSVKYEIKESSTSVSLYIYKKIPSTRQLYILRISDHLPSMQKLVRGDDEPRPSVDENANVSIDFYKPKRIRRVNATTGEVNIKKVPNKFDNYVGVPASIPQVEPFTVSSYEYFYKNLEQGDEMILWHSIASWVCCLSPNKEYHDPFASDEKKRAKTEVKTAEVHVFGDKAEIITENKRYQKMNRINEIGDTPRGQYMLGRLSQSYDEPKIYSDDYDEKPEIASYASDNWHKYGRGDDNENAFNLGRGDEEGVRWIDDGSQRRFRERHGLPHMNRQLHKESRHTDMNRKLIRLTESDLRRIIKESVNRILKEGYYDFDDDFNADDVECPYCGSNNVEPISAIDTHYRCLDCGEEFYLDGGWEPDWGAMRHESHKRKGKNINEATTPTWKRWQGYTPDQKAERLAYMQQQIAQLKQQREYAKQKAKTARTPEEQQTWRNTKAQIDRELLRVVSHEHDLRVGKKMTQGAKERAAIKRREDRTKAKNRITFQPQDDPYYVSESKIHRMYTILDGQHFVTVNSAQRPERFDVTIDSVKPYVSIGGWEGYGNEAMQTINDIYSYYKQCGDVKRAISEYINNF